MRKLIGIILLLVLIINLISCQEDAALPKPTEFPTSETYSSNNAMTSIADDYNITHENYPKIDGSTSTLSLVKAINRAMYKYMENDNFPYTASKTVPSYKMLIDGDVDMIIVPYASTDILSLADDKGVKLEFYPIALESLVFITSIENEAENITEDQVRKIYIDYGIKNWSELGGPTRELVPICRNADSGSQSQMDNLILKGNDMHPDIQKNYVELTMEGMLELVAFYHNGGLDGSPTDSYALGYTLYTYLESIGEVTGIDERLKILSYEGIVPTEENMANGSYPLTDGYYAVIRSDLPKDHSARSIIQWLNSSVGKEAIRKVGLVPSDIQ